MSRFFIERPIFAWVIAIFIILLGGVAIFRLPMSQFPQVAPPKVTVSLVYPGADAQKMQESVVSVIEKELNGATGMIYMTSTSESNGMASIEISFEQNISPELAQIDIQNRVDRAKPRLPLEVVKQGIIVEKSGSSFLEVVSLVSQDGGVSEMELNDYVARNVLPEIQRVKGVATAQQFGSEYAIRVWVYPYKLKKYEIGINEVNAAIAHQNMQVPAGNMGSDPAIMGQSYAGPIIVQGQLKTVEAFENIILRSKTDGSIVRLKDVAKVELAKQDYSYEAKVNGKANATIAVRLSPDGNALETAKLIQSKMDEIQQYFPKNVSYIIPYDSTQFISASIEKVVHTLLEAVVLVFIIMLLFLQNLRYTIIPTIVVPIALLGSLVALWVLGFSLNVLSMLGMVLVIGIVVDDAIVVVENVERIMREDKLSPKQATIKAMHEITGAIIGITVVLISVFVPLAFFPGATGNIYRQFSASMVSAIAFSAFLALTLTPALCASFLSPIPESQIKKNFIFRYFSHYLLRAKKSYATGLKKFINRRRLMGLFYVVIIGLMFILYKALPTAFLPTEDQGVLFANIILPAGGSSDRTNKVLGEMTDYFIKQPEVAHTVTVEGFSFSGNGQSTGLAFISLKPWNERSGSQHSAEAVKDRAYQFLGQIRDGFVFLFQPPPIVGLGNSEGFDFRLQDRGGKGRDALIQARDQVLNEAHKSPILRNVRNDGLPEGSLMELVIDRDKANVMGINFDTISTNLGTMLGSAYINDFPNKGRMQRVIVQLDAPYRMNESDILNLPVRTKLGELVPISSFAHVVWHKGEMQAVSYNGYPAFNISGEPAPGYSTGDAMAEMAKIASHLPHGFGFEWSSQSREEILAGNAASILFIFSILSVFLCLSALYESWSIPFSVLLVVPLGIVGVLIAIFSARLNADIYFQIGLVTVIGLSAKNAILIIEFAKELEESGKSIISSALEAALLRFRPILMTSLAFILGVIPLALARGASSASQHTIGIGVIGGMVTGTFFALAFVPVSYVIVRMLTKQRNK